MSKTTDTTKPRELTDDHRLLADSELDTVTGGSIAGGSTDVGWVDTSEATARRPLGAICNVAWASTKTVSVTAK
jgi:hypothetical protein